MKIPFDNLWQQVKERFSLRKILSFWYRHHKALFFICFFVVILMGAWNWYYIFYQYRLSEAEKKQYIEQNFRETVFKEKPFEQVVDMIAKRTHPTESSLVNRDIFQGKGIPSDKKEAR